VLGYADQGLAFDVAVHVGSLGAVVWYFRRDIAPIVGGMFRFENGRASTFEGRLGWAIGFATIPVGLAGLMLKDLVEHDLRSTLVIAITTIGFGLLLMGADMTARRQRRLDEINWKDVLVIGLFQAIALIPGTSRSGITMTAGLFLGLTREAASRFSFLLSVPTILLSGGLVTLDLLASDTPVHVRELVLGAILSFAAAYLCIHFFLKFIERVGMMPFVIYRLILGAVLLTLLI